MTIQQNFKFNGLNLRQSDIVIPPEFATDVRNCDLNYSRELRKRNGFDLDATMPGGKQIIYMVEYREKNELVAMASDGLYRKNGANFDKIPMSITGAIPTWTADTTSIEINGTIYFSDTAGDNYVFKYDGNVFSRAGVPKPNIEEESGLLEAPSYYADNFFGYDGCYCKGFTATDNGILYLNAQKPNNGVIWAFENTAYGFKRITGPFTETNVASIQSSLDGNTVVILRIYPNTLMFGDNIAEFVYYQRTVSNQNYTVIQSGQIVNYSWQIYDLVNFKLSPLGNTFCFSASNKNFTLDGPIITFTKRIGSGTFLQLTNIPAPVLNSGFGYAIDLSTDGNVGPNDFLIVGAPSVPGSSGVVGRAYIYSRANSIADNGLDWTLLQTINSPTTTTTLSGYGYGMSVNMMVYEGSVDRSMLASINYLTTGNVNQVNLLCRNTTTGLFGQNGATGIGFNTFITIPGGELVPFFGYSAALIGYSATTRKLFISSPQSTSTLGGKTYGKIFVYTDNTTAAGNLPNFLLQTLESPDISYDNDTASNSTVKNIGFGGKIITLYNFNGIAGSATFGSEKMAISFPDFNYLDINYAGRTFAFDYNANTNFYSVDKSTSTNESFSVKIITSYVDYNGNLINSEETIIKDVGSRFGFKIKTFRNTEFNDRYFINDTSIAFPAVTNATPTILVATTSHNLSVGNKVSVLTYTTNPNNLSDTYPHQFQLLEVTAVVPGTSVTLKTGDLLDDTYITNRLNYKGVVTNVPMNGSTLWYTVFISSELSFGYQLLDSLYSQQPVTHDVDFLEVRLAEVNVVEEPELFLSDIYDESSLKKEIPKIKYLGSYQGMLIGANIVYDNEPFKNEFKNRFIWSDASIGGSVETFAPFDYEVIGENYNKELTGVMGTADNIHIFKSTKCYAINGLLIDGQYRVRELISEETGCFNHNSLVAVRGGVLFMSGAGIYTVNGGASPKELSDSNQPLFLSTEWILTKSVSILDGLYEKIYIFLKNTDPAKNMIVVWNYYFDQWFIYDGIPMTGPMAMYNDKFYVANGDKLLVQKTGLFTDYISPGVTVPVKFRYATGWWHMGRPSLRKKFVNLVLMSLLRIRDFSAIPFSLPAVYSDPPDYSLDVAVQINWIPTDVDSFTVDFSRDIRLDDHKLAIIQSNSLRFIFKNELATPVLLTGYEFEWEDTQTKPKGVA